MGRKSSFRLWAVRSNGSINTIRLAMIGAGNEGRPLGTALMQKPVTSFLWSGDEVRRTTKIYEFTSFHRGHPFRLRDEPVAARRVVPWARPSPTAAFGGRATAGRLSIAHTTAAPYRCASAR